MHKRLYKVKYKYFPFEFEHNFKQPCMAREYGEFLFNWSLETCKQFARHLLSMQPTKFYISNITEAENITVKKEVFQEIINKYSKLENKKIDKFELLSIIPFIVESNFEFALSSALSFFCIENEGGDILMRNEFGLFLDSFFRSVHNIVSLDDVDEIYEKTSRHILRISYNELEEMVAEVYEGDEEEMRVDEVCKKFGKMRAKGLMKTINGELYNSLKMYEKIIKEELFN